MIAMPGFLLRDLRGASKVRSLWVFSACLLLGIALVAATGSRRIRPTRKKSVWW